MVFQNLQDLKKIFHKYPQIQAVYLFGSAAAGRTRPGSDIDLAVFSDDKMLHKRQLDILADLAQEGFCNVDLVFPTDGDIVLQYEAVRQNTIIYQRADFNSGAFFSIVVRKYLDFLPYLNVQRRAYKDRILNGQT